MPLDEETRLIRQGAPPKGGATLARTVNPPIQRGSTVLLPNAAALYDDDQLTYGITGLSSPAALQSALAELEGSPDVGAMSAPVRLGGYALPRTDRHSARRDRPRPSTGSG